MDTFVLGTPGRTGILSSLDALTSDNRWITCTRSYQTGTKPTLCYTSCR